MASGKKEIFISMAGRYIQNFEDKHSRHYSFNNKKLKNEWLISIGFFKNSLAKFSDKLTREDSARLQASTKFLYRYAKYLDEHPDPETEKWFMNIAKVIKSSTSIENLIQDCTEIITKYNQQFSDKDWAQAQQYFKANPDKSYAGSQNGLMFSYIKISDNEILRRQNTVGEGSFGSVRATTSSTGKQSDYLIKSQKYSDQVKKEAGIVEDLGQSKYGLIMRTDLSPGSKQRKSYQPVISLGTTLADYLKSQPKRGFDDSLDLAIDVLLKVSGLHSGKASKSNTRYAHLDIKPDNILVGTQNSIELIDFGTSKVISKENIDEPHQNTLCTIGYSPIDIDNLLELENNSPINILEVVKTTPSYFFDDRVAVLRTLYHPLLTSGIFTESQFSRLPEPIQDLIDTTSIKTQIEVNENYSLKLITAVLIKYKMDKIRLWSYSAIEKLALDEELQNKIIKEHEIISGFKQGPTKENVELISNGVISISDIPLKFLDISYIRALFEKKPEHLEGINAYFSKLLTSLNKNHADLRKEIINYLVKEQPDVLKDLIKTLEPRQLTSLIELSDNEDVLLNLILDRNNLSYRTLLEVNNKATQNKTFIKYIEKIENIEVTLDLSRLILVGRSLSINTKQKQNILLCKLIEQLEHETLNLRVEWSKNNNPEQTEKFKAAHLIYMSLKESFKLYDAQKIDEKTFKKIVNKAINTYKPKLENSEAGNILNKIVPLINKVEKGFQFFEIKQAISQFLSGTGSEHQKDESTKPNQTPQGK